MASIFLISLTRSIERVWMIPQTHAVIVINETTFHPFCCRQRISGLYFEDFSNFVASIHKSTIVVGENSMNWRVMFTDGVNGERSS
jgi:hypothetical protein